MRAASTAVAAVASTAQAVAMLLWWSPVLAAAVALLVLGGREAVAPTAPACTLPLTLVDAQPVRFAAPPLARSAGQFPRRRALGSPHTHHVEDGQHQ